MPGLAALVVAAGRGVRAASDVPKQYALLGGKPLLRRTLEALGRCEAVTQFCVVIGEADQARFAAATDGLRPAPSVATGGPTRQASVRHGLEALVDADPQIVLIHDAARPFVSPRLVGRLAEVAEQGFAAIPGLSLTDTIKRVEEGAVAATVPRDGLYTVQTPQAFPFRAILAAHRQAAAAGREDLTDDAAVAEFAGLEVRLVEGEERNIKITRPGDWARAEAMIAARMETRTGQGYDVHAFGPGEAVWLCGVEIPHDRALLGHSDADVGLHALTDAILGALGDGDIGAHFPPSDPVWKGASSDRFLADAVRRVAERGGAIVNLDVTLICEAPKIGPHRERMREAVARIAGVPTARVGVKATTSEGLGFTGRREGIAALAIATIRMPEEE